MNLTYIHVDLARCFWNVISLLPTFTTPVFMHLLFDRAQYSDVQWGRGTAGSYVMSSMGAYGIVIAAIAIVATAATKSVLGWGRQLALAKQQPPGFVVNKVVVTLVFGALPSSLMFIVGALTGAKADAWWVWVTSWATDIPGTGLFGVHGLVMGLSLKSGSVTGVASGTVVFLVLLGDTFVPLIGVMLDIVRFTPMYGYVSLVGYPQVEGEIQ